MKAIILAAGFGTRLKPLTLTIPKALIKYKNLPLIEHQIFRLQKAGVNFIVVNLHHLAEQIEEYLKKKNFGIEIITIFEPSILGTGGAILNSYKYLKDEDFFWVVNVDSFCNLQYNNMIAFHKKHRPLATIAVQKRISSRHLIFDRDMTLLKRAEQFDSDNTVGMYAFNGIHILSQEFFNLNYPVKYCDIIDLYLDATTHHKKMIKGYDVGNVYYKDMGKLENIKD
ncbi:MAG: nucleotidyltransferase family protein [Ignavibacteria bacterium]